MTATVERCRMFVNDGSSGRVCRGCVDAMTQVCCWQNDSFGCLAALHHHVTNFLVSAPVLHLTLSETRIQRTHDHIHTDVNIRKRTVREELQLVKRTMCCHNEPLCVIGARQTDSDDWHLLALIAIPFVEGG